MATLINDRIDVRISREQKELIKHASVLRGFKNVSEFIVTFVTNEASKIVSENNNILTTLEDKKLFIETILNPPVANDKLKNAQLNHSKLIAGHESRIRIIK